MASNYVFSYTTQDLSAPVSTIVDPANGGNINIASPDPYTISGTATDNDAVTGVEISINGGAWTAAACSNCPGSTVNWTYSWIIPLDNTITIQSRATDSSSIVETPSGGNTVTVDRTAPAITTTVPADSAAGIVNNSNVTLTWSENIDCTTVNTSTVTIAPSAGWTRTSCSAAQAVFTPSGQTGSTIYTVTVSSAVSDTAGNPMAANHLFTYTTRQRQHR
jgi:hypothetical protein